MTQDEAIRNLELLMEGIHPVTGEILPEDVFSDPEVVFSLRLAIRALRLENRKQIQETDQKDALEQYVTKRGRLNAGRSWTEEDDRRLKELYQEQASTDEMCTALQRRSRGLNNRLEYLSLIPARPERYGNVFSPDRERMGKPWYPVEDQKLREMFDQQKPIKEMARVLKRSERGVQFRMERLQLINNAENYPETEEQSTRKDNEDLRKRYLGGQSIAEIAASYHISEKAVQARLFYLGMSSKSPIEFPQLK